MGRLSSKNIFHAPFESTGMEPSLSFVRWLGGFDGWDGRGQGKEIVLGLMGLSLLGLGVGGFDAIPHRRRDPSSLPTQGRADRVLSVVGVRFRMSILALPASSGANSLVLACGKIAARVLTARFSRGHARWLELVALPSRGLSEWRKEGCMGACSPRRGPGSVSSDW